MVKHLNFYKNFENYIPFSTNRHRKRPTRAWRSVFSGLLHFVRNDNYHNCFKLFWKNIVCNFQNKNSNPFEDYETYVWFDDE